MEAIVLIVLIAMVLLCAFVLWTYINTVYGLDIITPINTHNNETHFNYFVIKPTVGVD